MTASHSSRYLADLVRELCALPHETEWVEFKENFRSPESMGRYISALANSAVLHGSFRFEALEVEWIANCPT